MSREILHVALGSSACHLAAHHLNLQGLSVTTNNNEESTPSCDPSITHTTYQQLLVPRALLVDSVTISSPQISPPLSQQQSQSQSVPSQNDKAADPANTVEADWFVPAIKALSPQEVQTVQSSSLWGTGTVKRLDTGRAEAQQDLRVSTFREIASQLSVSSYSRYRAPLTATTTTRYSISSNNQRTVDWDDMSEEENENEEDEEEHQMHEQRQRRHWNQQVRPQLQDQMDAFWGSMLLSDGAAKATGQDTNGKCEHAGELQVSTACLELSWRDYFMPPFRPDSILNLLPFDATADRSEWGRYYPWSQNMGAVADRQWVENDFLDHVRLMLEDCGSCQGVTLVASGHGVNAGLATQLLYYLKDDVPGARRFVWSMEEYDDKHSQSSSSVSSDITENGASWRTRHVENTRHNMELGLMWYDYLESAHAILTLELPPQMENKQNALFLSASILGAALESTTLAYRLAKTPTVERRLGLNSYYYGSFSGDSPFGSTDRLSLSEFLANLLPAPGLSVLELDVLFPTFDFSRSSLVSRLMQGTSLERDQRTKRQPQLSGVRRHRDVEPGEWMMDPSRGGILSPLSPLRKDDRMAHTHFALASSLRHETHSAKISSVNYVDCLMQGMGIRFRPEQSLALHLGESLDRLTRNGYGAGSYWKHIWNSVPVLSVLGNTTRFYHQANKIGTGVKDALSPKSRGFLNRDVSNEILPERDICHEVLSSIYNIRDKYQPPHGSGWAEDEVATDFMD